MNKKCIFHLLAFIIVIYLTGCALFIKEKAKYDYDKMDRTTERIHKKVEAFLENCITDGSPVKISRFTRIDSLIVDEEKEHVDIYLNRFFSFIPFRQNNVDQIYAALEDEMGWWDSEYSLTVHTTNNTIEQLIPNYFRSDPLKYDYSRLAQPAMEQIPIVRNCDKPWQTSKGLYNRHIALWPSHGWYYERQLDRWEWQRARLFQSVEDLGPLTFTLPYLVPMLENAGANVFLPRERDIQTNEIIIDNDSYNQENVYYLENSKDDITHWKPGDNPGFAIGHPPYRESVNPFRLGSYRQIAADDSIGATIEWIPDIPVKGKYAVYISYASSDSNIADAHYTVFHTGGITNYLVNQQIGGGTWIYLGDFIFAAGHHPDRGRVVLSNQSVGGRGYVTADAIRFGGGMGNVARGGKISQRPRYMEAARYYLQFAGMPDTLVYSLSGNQNDYTDDYRGRGEWVNYLKGKPFGPNENRMIEGLGIPLDLSLAFHTDAGISQSDTVIGTLSIYSTFDADSNLIFPDSVSRFANRDLADLIQTQIVEDARILYDHTWSRRGLWDRGYSEAFRPNVPAMLLELLSHQNFIDMQFFLDPRFRFDIGRSIYKAIVKFLATQHQQSYVIQPLPVTEFMTVLGDHGQAFLHWKPRFDPLEPSAKPQKYIVYTRVGDYNFDNGVLVDTNYAVIEDLTPGIIYSFKVTAVNAGGESFPSEILALSWLEDDKMPILVVNGFDRVCGPETVESEKFKGFVSFLDAGVPDRYELDYVGAQFNFNPLSKWRNDDSPGFGSSYADMETQIIPGNTHDFVYDHGEAITADGRSFVSVSDEAVMRNRVSLSDYSCIDLILGEEKKTFLPKQTISYDFQTFPDSLQKQIQTYCLDGGNIFISGAYVGTDLFEQPALDTTNMIFARKVLKYFHRTNHASKKGQVIAVDTTFSKDLIHFKFNTYYDPAIYSVESPDAIEPSDSTSHTILRYTENNMSAGIAFKGDYNIVVFGFPFETILGPENKRKVMQVVLNFLEQ